MRLFIMRHGEAEPFKQPDAERVLTVRGIQDTQSVGALLKSDLESELKPELATIQRAYVSPYVRAQQTFDNVNYASALNLVKVDEPEITPNGHPQAVLPLIQSALDEGLESILLVSHQPLVSRLVATLVEGSESFNYQYPMMPASLAELRLDVAAAGCADLVRLLSPPYA